MSETRILPHPMRRLRRTPIQPRIELIPLIDVMTFLITYFIYATATLMRVDLVPMELHRRFRVTHYYTTHRGTTVLNLPLVTAWRLGIQLGGQVRRSCMKA